MGGDVKRSIVNRTIRSGFVDVDVDAFALLVRGPDHAKGRADAGCSQSPCIAMSEYIVAIVDEACAVATYRLAKRHVLVKDHLGLVHEAIAREHEPIDRPHQIDRRRTSGAQLLGCYEDLA